MNILITILLYLAFWDVLEIIRRDRDALIRRTAVISYPERYR